MLTENYVTFMVNLIVRLNTELNEILKQNINLFRIVEEP